MRFLDKRRKILVISFGSIAVLVLIAVIVILYFIRPSAEYALLIDAGSSGSRIHLYKWLPEDDDRLPIITELRLDKKCDETEPGLSKLGGKDDTLPTVRESLALLITCAKLELTDRIANFQKVRLYLMATAGMRLLKSENDKTKQRHKKILKQVSDYLDDVPFDLQGPITIDAKQDPITIDAKEEALYAWVAANYLNGSLGKASKKPTIGILELGGASAQIAFVPNDPTKSNPKNTAVVPIPGGDHQVYATGYDGVGKKKFIEAFEGGDSCDPAKYEATDEASRADIYKKCKDQIQKHFDAAEKDKDSVFYKLKKTKPNYDGKYLALSNFYHTPNFFWQKYNRKFSELESAGIEYCKKNMEVIREENKKVQEKFLGEYCLMAAYIPTLLTTEGFSVISVKGGESRVMLRLEESEADVDWTLGALICSLYDGCPFGS